MLATLCYHHQMGGVPKQNCLSFSHNCYSFCSIAEKWWLSDKKPLGGIEYTITHQENFINQNLLILSLEQTFHINLTNLGIDMINY